MTKETIPFGSYRGEISQDFLSPWDAALWYRRRLQRKAFVYAGVFSDDFILGFAIADVGYCGVAFFYSFDRQKKILHEEKSLRPLAFAKGFTPSLKSSWNYESKQGLWRVSPVNNGWHFEFQGKKLQTDFTLLKEFDGITAIAPALKRPFNTTYKLASATVQGSLQVQDERKEFVAQGVLDVSLGYPARRTFWHWACFCGTSAEGKRIGINLVGNHNDGLENTLWIEGESAFIQKTDFQPGEKPESDPWKIQSKDGSVSLEFFPEGARREKINYLLISNNFTQAFGSFRGTLKHQGRDWAISGSGVCEIHSALW